MKQPKPQPAPEPETTTEWVEQNLGAEFLHQLKTTADPLDHLLFAYHPDPRVVATFAELNPHLAYTQTEQNYIYQRLLSCSGLVRDGVISNPMTPTYVIVGHLQSLNPADPDELDDFKCAVHRQRERETLGFEPEPEVINLCEQAGVSVSD